jgi:DNA-binding Lrp family transcriptional regulator
LENVKRLYKVFHIGIHMSIAFVLINTDLGEGSEVEKALKEIPEVHDVYGVYGVYDFVVRLEADTMQELKEVITSKIRRLSHVRSTLTMIVVD